MNDFFSVMILPMLACFILTGIHAYLGFHVIERQVIFVDLALAQIAVLGASFAIVLGYSLESIQSYWLSLGFTIIGAAIFSLTRFRKQKIPHEAIIGIIYAVSAALLVIILSRSAEGDEHIRQALTGNILLVSWSEVVKIFMIYSVLGFIHFVFRRQLLSISQNSQEAFERGVNIKGWDFLFYVLFGIVVTSSVKIAGVLLVFSFLIIPSVGAMMLAEGLRMRLILGWVIGFLGSFGGIVVSYSCDFPTAAAVVCVLGTILFFCPLLKGKR